MQQTQRRSTMLIRDLVTGKTMTVEEWKRLKGEIAEAIAAEMASKQTNTTPAKEQA